MINLESDQETVNMIAKYMRHLAQMAGGPVPKLLRTVTPKCTQQADGTACSLCVINDASHRLERGFMTSSIASIMELSSSSLSTATDSSELGQGIVNDNNEVAALAAYQQYALTLAPLRHSTC